MMKNKNILLLVLPIIAVVLECLPYGAVLNFANPEGASFRQTYSYFSLTPFGYANFSPFITAVLTCVILILTVFFIFKPTKMSAYVITGISFASFVISLSPLLFGIDYFSVVGALISAVLLIYSLIFYFNKVRKFFREENE